MFRVAYHSHVTEEDIPKLPKKWKDKIRQAIEAKLMTHPDLYGKPLRQSLKGYRKLRVGDYRIVFRIKGKEVKILIIQHRSAVYTVAEKRL